MPWREGSSGRRGLRLALAGVLAGWSLTGMFLVASVAMLAVTAYGGARSSVRAIA